MSPYVVYCYTVHYTIYQYVVIVFFYFSEQLIPREYHFCLDLEYVCLLLQITYIETSAKDPPMNVDKAFHELVRVIR